MKMSYIDGIKRMLNREKITSAYASKNRYIPQAEYMRLKKVRVCGLCKGKIRKIPEIHHIKPISEGGNNDSSNLMAAHPSCHSQLHLKAKNAKKVGM